MVDLLAGEIVVPTRSDFSRIAAINPILRNARSHLRDECPVYIQNRTTSGSDGKAGSCICTIACSYAPNLTFDSQTLFRLLLKPDHRDSRSGGQELRTWHRVCRQSISDSWLGNLRECLAHLV